MLKYSNIDICCQLLHCSSLEQKKVRCHRPHLLTAFPGTHGNQMGTLEFASSQLLKSFLNFTEWLQGIVLEARFTVKYVVTNNKNKKKCKKKLMFRLCEFSLASFLLATLGWYRNAMQEKWNQRKHVTSCSFILKFNWCFNVNCL